jgi:hypothetical protein
MALIINTKTKQQEKVVKAFLEKMDIHFTKAEEDEVPYRTNVKKPLGKKETKLLNNLDKSVDFVNKYKKGKVKAKSLNQLLDEL